LRQRSLHFLIQQDLGHLFQNGGIPRLFIVCQALQRPTDATGIRPTALTPGPRNGLILVQRMGRMADIFQVLQSSQMGYQELQHFTLWRMFHSLLG
jgi:hypothetical protein